MYLKSDKNLPEKYWISTLEITGKYWCITKRVQKKNQVLKKRNVTIRYHESIRKVPINVWQKYREPSLYIA